MLLISVQTDLYGGYSAFVGTARLFCWEYWIWGRVWDKNDHLGKNIISPINTNRLLWSTSPFSGFFVWIIKCWVPSAFRNGHLGKHAVFHMGLLHHIMFYLCFCDRNTTFWAHLGQKWGLEVDRIVYLLMSLKRNTFVLSQKIVQFHLYNICQFGGFRLFLEYLYPIFTPFTPHYLVFNLWKFCCGSWLLLLSPFNFIGCNLALIMMFARTQCRKMYYFAYFRVIYLGGGGGGVRPEAT